LEMSQHGMAFEAMLFKKWCELRLRIGNVSRCNRSKSERSGPDDSCPHGGTTIVEGRLLNDVWQGWFVLSSDTTDGGDVERIQAP
jgi:hypothetical protein